MLFRASQCLYDILRKPLKAGRSGADSRCRHAHNIPTTKIVRRFVRLGRGDDSAYVKDLAEIKLFVDIR